MSRTVLLPSASATHEAGRRLGGVLRAGDLLILSGDLGAGKTTLTQGIGAGLGVQGAVTSPTFVIARQHRPDPTHGADGQARPGLVHVDAYRLGGLGELDDLDLDTSLEHVVTVVEWGDGLAERLEDSHLRLVLTRVSDGSPLSDRGDGTSGGEDVEFVDDDAREVQVSAAGARWDAAAVSEVVAALRG